MPASDAYPYGVDPAHVWAIATAAAPASRRNSAAVLVGGRYAARVHLPSRRAAQAVHAALRRVGYQVGQPAGGERGRDLIVAGWSAEGLESRLTAMRSVLGKLASEPTATAAAALAQLARVPAAALPGPGGQRQLISDVGEQLRIWVWDTSGIHAPCDPRARPADPGCALRLAATRRAEAAIDDLAVRHMQVAEVAVVLYPALRQRMGHDRARDFAIRRAGLAFHFSPQQLGQDLTTVLRSTDGAPGPAGRLAALPASPLGNPPTAGTPTSPEQAGPPPGWPTAGEFPAASTPISPASRPPSTRGVARPGGRNFPSGRPGRPR